jgi:hypothetical protein
MEHLMNTTHTRRKFARTSVSAAAVALATSLAACTTVTHGAAVVDDRGPCTHVAAPMLDIPTASDTEPQMRIPQPPGWERSTELEGLDESFRLGLANTELVGEPSQNAVTVMVESVPDADAQTLFDGFHAGMVEVLDEEGLQPDITRTAGTLCGLPSETITLVGADMGMGAAVNALPPGPATMLLVVAESGADTYLVAVVQTIEPDNPTYQRDAETILTGFEVLTQVATAA